MLIEIDAIIAQMKWAAARGLSEFAVNTSGARIHIRRSGALTASAASQTTHNHVPSSAETEAPTPNAAKTVDAPMAGICHLSGDSDSAPFVSVGDAIGVGQTICLIEAMKVMTSITATTAGTVKAILVEDGVSVDAGTALIEVSS
ncbi:acetyl-CoA carboxylase biotin carboxyl carrier protein [Pacificibacter marinus]|uniref:Biotin carboxyl carrier protein of acetyl-CoA carboxylase n=1 Tax=Pacificibacter marinus TaxID=658057 RepID=A0A1Y5TDY1_9RHOB|nr:biotin/lipoyl-containing protein [Pacificibacter marinus]SEL08643.1 acetyl-CoA carboxylase biotin carboxyl carrier protein [Pacificibacter marinus]SLN58187.1 Biotin carboxyl carrier protein of acetyl-CoA carboxylase [Pacificibacter marinus]